MFSFRKTSALLRQNSEHEGLPLAPMADVFIVVLIFLLKSFSYDLTNVEANTDINLPSAKANGKLETTLRIDLSENELRYNDQLVTKLQGFQFKENEIDANGDLIPLQETLRKLTSNEEPLQKTKVMLYADQKAPYATVRAVLKTAVGLGLSKLQIAVAEE